MDRESPSGTTRLAPNEKSLLTFTAVAHATSDALHVLYPALLFLMAADFDEDYLSVFDGNQGESKQELLGLLLLVILQGFLVWPVLLMIKGALQPCI